MPPMPPEFYIPAFGALIAALGILATVIKVLWATLMQERKERSDFQMKTTGELAATIALNSVALQASTDALEELAAHSATDRLNRRR